MAYIISKELTNEAKSCNIITGGGKDGKIIGDEPSRWTNHPPPH